MEDSSLRLGFIGLGVMGRPMAGHLLAAGHPLTVWNRTPGKAEGLGAKVAGSIEELAAESDVVFLCVSRTEDVRACLRAAIKPARPGTLFVDHSTIEPREAEDIAVWLSGLGFRFVDAPVTGGSMGAQAGTLTVFLGGDEKDCEVAAGLAAAYGKRIARVGKSGAGQWIKMANQIAVGGALAGLCESLNFAQKAGLDVEMAKNLIGAGAGGSWAFENYGPKILKQDWSPGFAIDHQRKDFAYCAEAAKSIGAAIPTTLVIDELLRELQAQGHGQWTTAALYQLLQEKQG